MAFFRQGTLSETVVIDVDTKTTSAKILREGVEFTAPATSTDAVAALVGALGQFTTFEEPRVMRQVPPPGTLVAPGTAVTLTLVPPSDTPFNVFTGVHTALGTSKVAALVNLLGTNDAVAAIVAAHDGPENVPVEDQTTLAAAAGVSVDESAADTGFGALFNSYKVASVYK